MGGLLIDFEGIDGSGKKTQAKLLRKALLKKGFQVTVYSYPNYKSKYGQIVKRFLDGSINLNADEQFLLYLLDMVKDKKEVKQKLQKGFIVIMDRYFLSAIAYQCANHFDYDAAKKIVKLIDLPTPSIIFYLEIPMDVAYCRKRKQKGIGDIFEENKEFLEGVIKIYERMFKERFLSSSWVQLDGTEKPEVINRQVLLNVNKLIEEQGWRHGK
jgi:dTMP kinase